MTTLTIEVPIDVARDVYGLLEDYKHISSVAFMQRATECATLKALQQALAEEPDAEPFRTFLRRASNGATS